MTTTTLQGKTAIITGGAGGLGLAIATAFLQSGANVVICDINTTLLDSCTTSLQPLGPLLTVQTNVADEESVNSLFKSAIDKFGSVDILVNNAGLCDRLDGAADLEKAFWDRIVAVNLTGPFLTTKEAVRQFLSKGEKIGGVIVNIGSMSSLRGGIAGAAYTASKHGLLGLTKNTAAFYQDQNIRCNILLPGGMQTNMSASVQAEEFNPLGFEKIMKQVGMGMQMVETDKLARMAVHLSSDDGAIFNGAVIQADKGWSSH